MKKINLMKIVSQAIILLFMNYSLYASAEVVTITKQGHERGEVGDDTVKAYCPSNYIAVSGQCSIWDDDEVEYDISEPGTQGSNYYSCRNPYSIGEDRYTEAKVDCVASEEFRIQYTDETDEALNLDPAYDYNSQRALIGATKGKFGVNQGQANYKVDILAPPGINGLEPKLSLNYSSGSDNGYLGLGWSLGGTSVITRCAQTKAQDGDNFKPGIHYASTDRFCLDGKRLINISGSYGASGTEYRTEIDSYAKITSHGGGASSGPGYFIVRTKSGEIYTYGNDGSSDGFMGTSGGKPRYWKVKKIEDRFGNTIDFEYYTNASKGMMYLTKVSYADNSIDFTYESRDDDLKGYEAEYPYEIDQRLSKVTVYTNDGSQEVRSYALDYSKESYGSKRSRLVSITEGTPSGNLETLNFTWSDGQSNRVGVRKYGTNENIDNNGYIADFDGDGYLDIFIAEELGTTDCTILLNNKNNRFSDKNCHIDSTLENLKFIDFEGDGDIDIYEVRDKGSHYIWENNGKGDFGYSGTRKSGMPYTEANNLHFMDLNGDGLSDLLFEDNYDVEIYINNNGSFSKKDTISSNQLVNNQMMFNDFNADGAMDIYLLIGRDVHIWLNDGKGNFSSSADTELSLYYNAHLFEQVIIADFNGDGLMDIYEDKFGDSSSDYDYLYINKGNAEFTSKIRTVKTKYKIKAADFNGDGLADIYEYGDASFNQDAKLWINRGDHSFYVEENYDFYNYIDNIYFGDFNGDGLTDIYEARDSGFDDDQLWINQGEKPLIDHIYNGKDENINIIYEPLTNSSIYYNYRLNGKTISGSTDDDHELSIPMYVVSSAKIANGLGGQDTTSYFYKGYSVNRYRGSQGFYEVYRYHHAKKELTYTQYEQHFPFIGMKSEVLAYVDASAPTLSSISGEKVLEKSYTFTDQDYSANFQTIHQPHVSTSNTYGYDPEDSTLLSTLTESKVLSSDKLGNLQSQTKTLVDHTTGKTNKNVTTYEYDNENTTSWLIGKVNRITSTKETLGEADTKIEVIEELTYDEDSGAVLTAKKFLEGDQYLLKSYTYTPEGNVDTQTLSGTDIEQLTTEYGYGYANKFSTSESKTIDSRLFEESFGYDPRFGEITSHTDINGHVTLTTYNALGQKESQTNPDGSKIEWYYSWGGAANALYSVTTIADTKPYMTRYFDLLDREVYLKTHNLSGDEINQEKSYNAKGKIHTASLPYISGSTKYDVIYTYDTYNRLKKLSKPSPTGTGQSETLYDYSGFTTVETDAKGYQKEIVKNALDQKISITDGYGSAEASTVSYRYDGLGNLIEAIDDAGHVTAYTYDSAGRKKSESDPDRGVRSYKYDALDNLTYENDARGTQKHYDYDDLSRLTSMSAVNAAEGLSQTVTHTYDIRANGLGQVASTRSTSTQNGEQSTVETEYYYDTLSRVKRKSLSVDGETHTTEYTYDSASRTQGVYVTDALGKAFNSYYVYKNAFLFGVKNPESMQSDTSTLGYLYYTNETDAWGNVVSEQFANGVEGTNTYNTAGYLTTIYGETPDHVTQTVNYVYDVLGNVENRVDTPLGREWYINETFTYDTLNRISTMSIDTDAVPVDPFETTKSYRYDTIGNILQKGSINDYSYSGPGPHAVTYANGKAYTYDGNGNMLTRGVESLRYTAFDKPYSLTNSRGEETKFYYDASQSRYKKSTATYETLYLDRSLERKEESNGTVSYTGYFYFGDTLVAMKRFSESTTKTDYIHGDALESVALITDGMGNVIEERSYEPFGEIRSLGIKPKNTTELTDKSFTGHEQIDEIDGLIHMGGRVYDSAIGRFTSADIHVPHPYSTQSYNRYSYVRNNPLGFVDPSGYEGKVVNRAGLIEHLVQQKIGTTPILLTTLKDYTPKQGGIRGWALEQVKIDNPELFTDKTLGQEFLIDVDNGIDIITQIKADTYGDAVAFWSEDGINPVTGNILTPREQMDGRFISLIGAIPITRGLSTIKFTKKSTNHKPYSKSRPSYRKDAVDKVWENAKNRKGEVVDPYTGEKILWDKTKARSGQWDMGHKKGSSYKELHKRYMDGKINKEEFLNIYNDPLNYHPQTISSNRSRKFD